MLKNVFDSLGPKKTATSDKWVKQIAKKPTQMSGASEEARLL